MIPIPQSAASRRLAPAFLALGAFLAAAGCGAQTDPAAPAAPRVTHVRLSGPVDVGALSLVSRGIRAAGQQGARILLLELDTPGGSLEVLWDLQKQLLAAEESGIELACWIHDHAASAGALIALTAKSVYMSPAGTVGSAYPVLAGPQGLISLPEDGGVREKEISFLRAQFASMAERRGRPAALAKAMVDPAAEVRQVRLENELVLLDLEAWDDLRESGRPYELVATIKGPGKILNLTARQAVELRFADGIADDLAGVLQRLGHGLDEVSPALERSASDRAVVWIERLTPLLILAALLLGYVELRLPGFGLPGILSAVCFLTVVAGKYLAGLADVPHLVAVALGLALLVVELLVAPGTLWFGIAGGLLVAGGLLAASLGPGFSLDDPFLGSRMLDTGIEYALVGALAIALALLLSRWLPKAPGLRGVVLAPDPAGAFAGALPEAGELPPLGARGRVLTDLRPVGKVAIDGRAELEYEARSLGPFVAAGSRVRVIEVGEGRLVVEPVREERA
ncbi:MAG: hypothetical protein JNK02_05915 [Planctomycetes bacterium]|nr:hypothetical protein [Planctomycetota bacterium]